MGRGRRKDDTADWSGNIPDIAEFVQKAASMCRYIKDDSFIARYLGLTEERVRTVRANIPSPRGPHALHCNEPPATDKEIEESDGRRYRRYAASTAKLGAAIDGLIARRQTS